MPLATAVALTANGSVLPGLPGATLFSGQTEAPAAWELRVVESPSDGNGNAARRRDAVYSQSGVA